MKQSLQLKLSQHLALTPQLQQSIRLLQLSSQELNQELEQFIENNPLLERVDPNLDADRPEESSPFAASDQATATAPVEEHSEASQQEDSFNDDHDIWNEAAPSHGIRDDNDEPDYPQQDAGTTSLRDHLNWQLNLTQLPLRDRTIVSLMIDALNDDGYLTQSLKDIAEMLPPELEIDPLEVETALKHLQNFEPLGVGARNLGECLALQLEALPPDTPNRDIALRIARQYLEQLASRDYNKLKKLLQCDDDSLRAAQHLITGLNPRPGADFAAADTRYVVADVIVKKTKGMWIASLNREAMPKLRVNRMYAEILSRNREGGGQQLASQLQEARWMVKNIEQRFDTILRVSQAIVDRQKHFFEHGEVAMRPLVLREIADEVGLHESTISRVTTQKYMLTPKGIFELKYFFGS
ncbi:MAG: RNA polymerase factor sigma-54, partial [Sulfurimicrobium sp.]|nr:RNA polymerase factor sigma-54 [Sulfurimicrobium sp.]